MSEEIKALVTDEKLREAVEFILSSAPWKAKEHLASIEAALAELEERRKADEAIRGKLYHAQILYSSKDEYERNRGWRLVDECIAILPPPPATPTEE